MEAAVSVACFVYCHGRRYDESEERLFWEVCNIPLITLKKIDWHDAPQDGSKGLHSNKMSRDVTALAWITKLLNTTPYIRFPSLIHCEASFDDLPVLKRRIDDGYGIDKSRRPYHSY